MRPMSTERPSKTDSAVTLDAGHFQLETSLLNFVQDKTCLRGSCAKAREWDIGATTTLRLGLTQAAEIQAFLTPYQHLSLKNQNADIKDRREGYGDTTIRFKYNLCGNDGGEFALSVLPYVKVPTNQDNLGNDYYEWGLEVPFYIGLPDGWGINAMTQANLLRDVGRGEYYTAYVNSAALGRNITDSLSAYAELYTFKAAQANAKWQNTTDFGLVYALTANLRVDAGINIALSDAAADRSVFTGLAYRY